MKPHNHLYHKTVLVLQGGGALGSYQAGVYESLDQENIRPDWFAGISIGSINAAIMAGNPPEGRVGQLRAFWEEITQSYYDFPLPFSDMISRQGHAALSSLSSASYGIAGFFAPRFPPFWMQMPGAIHEDIVSYYDTSPLRETLLRYVDFDLINSGNVRLSLGSVNIRSGNFAYFDNQEIEIKPEHIMASGALPPGFPPVEIDGEYYWDGGLVSNTPLAYVLDHCETEDSLIFQVDLFSASGPLPQSLDMVEERRKDIIYSSRTRLNTDAFRQKHALRLAIRKLSTQLPKNCMSDPEIADLLDMGEIPNVSIVHLIYRPQHYDGPTKDYEFSRLSMREHWKAGLIDGQHTLEHKDWRKPPSDMIGIAVHDLTNPNRSK